MKGILGDNSPNAHEHVKEIEFKPGNLDRWFSSNNINRKHIPDQYKYQPNKIWNKQISGVHGIHHGDSAVARIDSADRPHTPDDTHTMDATKMHEGFHVLMNKGRKALGDKGEHLSHYLLGNLSDDTVRHIGHGLAMGGYMSGNKSKEQIREEVLAHVFQLAHDPHKKRQMSDAISRTNKELSPDYFDSDKFKKDYHRLYNTVREVTPQHIDKYSKQ